MIKQEAMGKNRLCDLQPNLPPTNPNVTNGINKMSEY